MDDDILRLYVDEIFSVYDKDHSQTLDLNEITLFLNDIFSKMNDPRRFNQQQALQTLKSIDVNNDGKASKMEMFMVIKKILTQPNQQQSWNQGPNYGQQGNWQGQQQYQQQQPSNWQQQQQGPYSGWQQQPPSNTGNYSGWQQQPPSNTGNYSGWQQQPPSNTGNYSGWQQKPQNSGQQQSNWQQPGQNSGWGNNPYYK